MRRQPRTFVDTNVFIYYFDEKELAKSPIARHVITRLDTNVVISTQVLQEFYQVVTKKGILTLREGREAVHRLQAFDVVGVTSNFVGDAIDLSILNQISIWDALMVQAAIVGRCDRILTEDLNHGQIIKGVRIENPFLEDGA